MAVMISRVKKIIERVLVTRLATMRMAGKARMLM
jgi:hypothetical protein